MLDTDTTYSLVDTIMIDLDDLFVIEEDTTYRDDLGFINTTLCDEFFFKLCTDELCTAEHTSNWAIGLVDGNTDGRLSQLSISTTAGFIDEIFYLQASNKGL